MADKRDPALTARYKRAGELTDELASLCPSTPSASWGAFLAVRHMLIVDMRREGRTDEDIAVATSVDAAQIKRIREAVAMHERMNRNGPR